MPISSLHHVTATVDDARADLDFYRGMLGLRLVKQTVNFDNHRVFHFYYGNEGGTPGTLMTTFPYSGMGVRVGRKGAGQVTATAFSVPIGSLARWRARLEERGIAIVGQELRFGEPVLTCLDPSSLVIELVEAVGDDREPWNGGPLEPSMAIRGLHNATLTIRTVEPTVGLLTGPLGFTVAASEGRRTRVAVAGGGAGRCLDLLESPDAPPAVNGLGTVHHVALAIGTAAEQLALRRTLLGRGLDVTEVRDRQYFTSIYFREPGGVLYEVATVGPGFTVDEDLASLGGSLKLPPGIDPQSHDLPTMTV
jgi:glyoxalase family protein